VVVNLASVEYARAALRPALRARVVDCVFEEGRPDGYRIVSFFAKQARGPDGALCRAAACAQRAAAGGLCRRRLRLRRGASTPDRLVFRRRPDGWPNPRLPESRHDTHAPSHHGELRRWIVDQAEAGCRPQDVIAAMRTAGWEEPWPPRRWSTRCASACRNWTAAPPMPVPASAVPEPDLGTAAPTVLQVAGHEVRVLLTLRHPRVVVFGGFLSDDECTQLMALAAPRLARSETVDNATGGSEVNAARTSDGMFFERGEHPLVQVIEARIAALLNWPVAHGEGIQVLRYRPGAEYRPHHDYFDPAHPGTGPGAQARRPARGHAGDVPQHPAGRWRHDLSRRGPGGGPIRGNAVFFSYDRPHASTRTLHGGAPVTAGEKWVATKWMREGRLCLAPLGA
jgi:prolyl 4-hydroxylase